MGSEMCIRDSSDIMRVFKPHLGGVFEGIGSLEFSEPGENEDESFRAGREEISADVEAHKR